MYSTGALSIVLIMIISYQIGAKKNPKVSSYSSSFSSSNTNSETKNTVCIKKEKHGNDYINPYVF